MEQGFDGWVRNRFHVESSDIPDIASHIDPNLFEPDWTLPSGVDDLFGWLTSNQDVAMDQTGTYEPQAAVNATAAAGVGPPAAVSQLQAGQQAALPAPQHQVSGRQLAYLQQALQQQPQSTDMQLAMPAQQSQQQQAMFPAGAGFQAQLPAAGMAFPASPAFLQQQQQQQQLQPDIWGLQGMPYADNAQLAQAASAGAVAGTGADAAHLQHADSSGRSSPSSGSSKQQQQKSSRAPIGKGKAGGGQRKPRKVTDAQRAAHKRFRIRRKEQVSSLVAEVAAKQEQLQALEAEHEALTAKARALDQLVASAGDSMMLMQRMEALSLGSQQQQQQQQQQQLPAAPSQGTSSAPTISSISSIDSSSLGSGPLGSTAALEEAKEAAAAATAAICAGTGTLAGADSSAQNPLDSTNLQAGTSSDAVSAGDTAGNAGSTQATSSCGVGAASGSRNEMQPVSGNTAAAAAVAAAALGGSSGSNGGTPSSPSAAAAASLERLESAVRAALGRPLPPPLQQQQQQQRLQLQQLEQVQVQQLQLQLRTSANQTLQLQGTVPALQRLVKSLINEIMQLVLQINKGQAMASAAAASAGSQVLAAAGALQGTGLGRQQVTAAAERLQNIRQQVYGEFRAFAATNRIDMCLLYTLNLETGVLVRPPAGHWVTGAQLLMQRLDPQTLQDIVMAHKLYTDALQKVQQQRRMLLMQLHASLCDSTSASFRRYTNDSLYSTTYLGPRTNAALLLNAVDSNLRKEYVMEGVFQWTLNKLLPPLLAAELVVTSYPFLTDLHHLAEELRRLIPSELDPTPGVTAVEQQRQEREQQLRAPVLPKIEPPQYAPDVAGLLPSSYQQQQMQQYGLQQQYSQQQQYGGQQPYLQQQGPVSQRQVSSGMVQVAHTAGLAAPFLSMPCS